MKIHEYQAKALFREYGIPVPQGEVARTGSEAAGIAKDLGGRAVVKAQIHAGGRGKGGGVKVVESPDAAREAASGMIGKPLVTVQTGPSGKIVNQVLVEGPLAIEKEYYLGLIVDRSTERVAIMVSREGGVEIERVAQEDPGKILKVFVAPGMGLMPYQARQLAFGLGLSPRAAVEAGSLIQKLYRLFVEKDCSLVEINPLAVTPGQTVVALDAKIVFDDNGLFRHPELAGLRDVTEEDPLEIQASGFGLSYIKLDGNVGCMVNGAGLAMATMDIIKLAGGEPANFLDVGGGAREEAVTEAFRIILSDENVKAVLVNILGGIVRCDVVAQGIINAVKNLSVRVPVVVRLEGTNAPLGLSLVEESGMRFLSAKGLGEAARKVVEAARVGGSLV